MRFFNNDERFIAEKIEYFKLCLEEKFDEKLKMQRKNIYRKDEINLYHIDNEIKNLECRIECYRNLWSELMCKRDLKELECITAT